MGIMGLIALKCPQCGADISFDNSLDFGYCNYCGSRIEKKKIIVDVKNAGFDERAKKLRKQYFLTGNITPIDEFLDNVDEFNPDMLKCYITHRIKSVNNSIKTLEELKQKFINKNSCDINTLVYGIKHFFEMEITNKDVCYLEINTISKISIIYNKYDSMDEYYENFQIKEKRLGRESNIEIALDDELEELKNEFYSRVKILDEKFEENEIILQSYAQAIYKKYIGKEVKYRFTYRMIDKSGIMLLSSESGKGIYNYSYEKEQLLYSIIEDDLAIKTNVSHDSSSRKVFLILSFVFFVLFFICLIAEAYTFAFIIFVFGVINICFLIYYRKHFRF